MHIPCPIKFGEPDSRDNDMTAYSDYTRVLAHGLLMLTYHWNRNNLPAAPRPRRPVTAPGPQARHYRQHQQHNEPERQKANGRRILLQGQRTKMQRVRNWLRATRRQAADRSLQSPQTPLLDVVHSTVGDGPMVSA
uniref:Succinate semialdehyde dehydrogenase [NAD(P)+] Sad n=1 Tax=Zeugodacus cucurbitae TaxID=28588 RepID=A0A0A1X4D5_ZEUCU